MSKKIPTCFYLPTEFYNVIIKVVKVFDRDDETHYFEFFYVDAKSLKVITYQPIKVTLNVDDLPDNWVTSPRHLSQN